MASGFIAGHERNVTIRLSNIQRRQKFVQEERKKTEKDRIEEQLGLMIGRIKNIEEDLKGICRDNLNVTNKLKILKEEKTKLEKELETYGNALQ